MRTSLPSRSRAFTVTDFRAGDLRPVPGHQRRTPPSAAARRRLHDLRLIQRHQPVIRRLDHHDARSDMPTCGAARPARRRVHRVDHIVDQLLQRRASILRTFFAFSRNTGSPAMRIDGMPMVGVHLSACFGGRVPVRGLTPIADGPQGGQPAGAAICRAQAQRLTLPASANNAEGRGRGPPRGRGAEGAAGRPLQPHAFALPTGRRLRGSRPTPKPPRTGRRAAQLPQMGEVVLVHLAHNPRDRQQTEVRVDAAAIPSPPASSDHGRYTVCCRCTKEFVHQVKCVVAGIRGGVRRIAVERFDLAARRRAPSAPANRCSGAFRNATCARRARGATTRPAPAAGRARLHRRSDRAAPWRALSHAAPSKHAFASSLGYGSRSRLPIIGDDRVDRDPTPIAAELQGANRGGGVGHLSMPRRESLSRPRESAERRLVRPGKASFLYTQRPAHSPTPSNGLLLPWHHMNLDALPGTHRLSFSTSSPVGIAGRLSLRRLAGSRRRRLRQVQRGDG